MKPIIRVENLGKQYRIGAKQERYLTLRDTLAGIARKPMNLLRGNGHSDENTFWALKDVSFDVMPGEVIGIIGRNGAGKSTLLKILSRITEPTTGSVDLYGRVGSLLEVGTGFHPELTGRENLYLNGAILGMKKSEIKCKFDEIVAFADIEKFLDTPVKHYSSGMYVRLAFAVAVHLVPELLIIDEVLAVGDAQFQKKCFEKMYEIGKEGRTILFVSHNIAALRNICHYGFLLEEGKIISAGEINSIADTYLSKNHDPILKSKVETKSFIINKVEIKPVHEPILKTFCEAIILVNFTAKTDIIDPGLYVSILTLDNQRLTGLDFKDFSTLQRIPAGQQVEMGFTIKSLPILSGAYQLEIHLKDMAQHKVEIISENFPFEIVETPVYGGRKLDGWYGFLGLNAQPLARIEFQ